MKFFSLQCLCAIIIVLVPFFLPLPASAEVYRWQDTRGQTHYSSAPPSAPAKNLEIKQGNYWIPYSADSGRSPQPTTPALTTVVPYRKDQAVITIPVTLNQHLEQLFAVDTGASYTIISRSAAEALNLRPSPELAPITLRTANGDIQAPLVNIRSLTIGGLTTYNIVAAIHDLHNPSAISGLLGLNVLDRFLLTVDSVRQQLTFTPVTADLDFLDRDCVAGRKWVQQGARLNDGSDEEAWLYQQALGVCPDLQEAYYRLGNVYYQQGAYALAIGVHQHLLQLAPEEAEAYYRLGVLYLLNRQFDLAKGAFQHTLRLAPAHPYTQEYLDQLQDER